MSGFTIGKLAKAAHVRIDTIRFYEKLGLLSPQRRPSGFREYSEHDRERLVFIRRARALGFSLDEISRFLLLKRGRVKAISDPFWIRIFTSLIRRSMSYVHGVALC